MGRPALAVRADVLERLAGLAHKLSAHGAFMASAALREAAGCGDDELAAILPELGFEVDPSAGELTFLPRAATRRAKRKRGKAKTVRRRPGQDQDSPFTKLQDLTIAS